MSDMIRVGIAGCGIGRLHAADFKKLPAQFQVTAVCDLEPAKAQALAAEQDIPRLAPEIHQPTAETGV